MADYKVVVRGSSKADIDQQTGARLQDVLAEHSDLAILARRFGPDAPYEFRVPVTASAQAEAVTLGRAIVIATLLECGLCLMTAPIADTLVLGVEAEE